ncbi:MAG: hypothetical protein LVO36_00255 [Nitrosopumilus sp. (ex Thoosa mismalolli)]|nr:hypothetical protein [Nitrosopumilus sp. (ex Thoosa mismalolli)]
MKQCKLCGTPLGKEPTTEELEKHWKKHHDWHWESNKDKTPGEAILKKDRCLGIVVVYSMPRLLYEGISICSGSNYKRKIS